LRSNTVAEPPTVASSAPAARFSERPFYRPELDILRFGAFFFVFVRHTLPTQIEFYQEIPLLGRVAWLLASMVQAGAFGVDLFFLLSAYLITELLVREKELKGALNVPMFYARRILRIWPLYFFAIALCAGLQFVLPGQELSLAAISWFLLLGGNWYTALYMTPNAFIAPLWSVSIEEQFYLLWPLAVRQASIKSIARIAVALILAASICRWIFYGLVTENTAPLFIWANTFIRLDTIGVGILLAVFARQRTFAPWSFATRAVSLCGGIACWLAANELQIVLPNPSRFGVMVGYPLMTIGSLLLLLSAYGLDIRPVSRIVRTPLIYLGRISYGLYVYHVLAFLLARHWLLRSPDDAGGKIVAVPVAFALTCAFAALSYRWLESPFLRLKERFTVVKSRPVD
jgi:peptidoglycan/LPS O-acetylase OafA/YrhL